MTITKIGSHAITQELRNLIDAGGTGTGTSSLSWFDVTDYGAVDGAESTVAFANAISALNSAGRGVLYIPAGSYITSGSFVISVPFLVMGDGITSFDDLQYVSRVTCSRNNNALFTITAKIGKFQNLALVNTSVSTPVAGSIGIGVSGSYLAQRIDYETVTVRGFYDNVDIQAGNQWVIDKCYFAAPVRYGLRIRNIVNADAGDWSISNTGFYAETYDSDAGIRIESSGGGKISNTKINMALDGKKFNYGIHLARSDGSETSILLISNNSIENIRGNNIRLETSSSSTWQYIVINGNQLSQYSNTDDYAIYANASVIGELIGLSIDNNVVVASPASSVEAISLTNINHARIGGSNIIRGFTDTLTQTGCINVELESFSVATDTIWDAKGDLAVGSGSNAAARLPVGTLGQVLTVDSSQVLGVKWATPSLASALLIYDDGIFKTTGSSISFNNNLLVDVTGSAVFVSAPVTTYMRVAQPIALSGATGAFWKVPEGIFASGSVAVFVNGVAKTPGIDYEEQIYVSGTYRFLYTIPTGSVQMVMYGIPCIAQVHVSTGTAESAFALLDSNDVLLLDSNDVQLLDSNG